MRNSLSLKLLLLAVGALLFSGCGETQSALNPSGTEAAEIATLWWIMLGLSVVVYLIVAGVLVAAMFRRRAASGEIQITAPPGSLTMIVAGGIVLPAIVLPIVFGLTLKSLADLSHADADDNTLVIEVIGHQFWWEVRYPQHDFVTANEIYIPANEPVQIRLTSADVIHSFWVPELAGKMDMIPGRTNTLWIEAAEEGEYRGQCAELCGRQHAFMAFYVIAMEPADFEEWVAQQQQPAPSPSDPITLRGQQIFMGSACVYCHTIQGTNATGDLGPDLTHLASRRTLGAGILPNTRGHLAGWIVDPQSIKPGNKMPPMHLEPEDLQALLAYMETLE